MYGAPPSMSEPHRISPRACTFFHVPGCVVLWQLASARSTTTPMATRIDGQLSRHTPAVSDPVSLVGAAAARGDRVGLVRVALALARTAVAQHPMLDVVDAWVAGRATRADVVA